MQQTSNNELSIFQKIDIYYERLDHSLLHLLCFYFEQMQRK